MKGDGIKVSSNAHCSDLAINVPILYDSCKNLLSGYPIIMTPVYRYGPEVQAAIGIFLARITESKASAVDPNMYKLTLQLIR